MSQIGDVLRLTTAVLNITDKVDVMSFYANPPKSQNRRAMFTADGQPFAKVMKAIVSNGENVDMPDGTQQKFDSVLLVLERKAA